MLLFRRLTPFISTLLIGAAYEALCLHPEKVYWLWAGLLALVLAAQLSLLKKAHLVETFILGISQILFLSGTYFLIFFVEGSVIRQFLIALALIINLFYITNIYYYHFQTEKYQVNALQNISSFLNLISIFTISSVGFSLILYLGWPSWLISLGVALASAGLCFQTYWVNKIIGQSAILFAGITGLIGGEVFWAVTFLPTSFLVNGAVVTVINYSVVNLARYYLMDKLQARVIWRYLIISVIVLSLTLATARWT